MDITLFYGWELPAEEELEKLVKECYPNQKIDVSALSFIVDSFDLQLNYYGNPDYINYIGCRKIRTMSSYCFPVSELNDTIENMKQSFEFSRIDGLNKARFNHQHSFESVLEK